MSDPVSPSIGNHPWNVDYHTAVAIQKEIAVRVDDGRKLGKVDTCGGVDVSYCRRRNRLYAPVLVFRFETMEMLDMAVAVRDSEFPYIPGLLTFREGPVVMEAFQKLTILPDVLIFDGQGIAHPRRAGLAAHLGVLMNIPAIGCAKKLLVGTFDPPGRNRGEQASVVFRDTEIARAVRTRTGVKPVFVSVGHRIRLPDAVECVLRAGRGYRLPEPTRQAHLQVNIMRKEDVTSRKGESL